MIRKALYCLGVLFLQIHCLFSIEGESSYPYLSGYTWCFFCDWRLLGEDYRSRPEEFDPQKVQLGDTIFVDYSRLEEFFLNYLPRIHNRFILITSNYGYGADQAMPGPFAYLLEDDKIAVWFVQNLDRKATERLRGIPIGIASRHWNHGNTNLLDQLIPQALNNKERPRPVYLNFTLHPQRKECFHHFQNMGIQLESPKTFQNYLFDFSQSVFVVSPPGNGVDCHRTWEALLMGCYPIVKSSFLNPLYEDLPVLIVDDWNEITWELLKQKKIEFDSKNWSRDKLYAPYWFEEIRKIQEQVKS